GCAAGRRHRDGGGAAQRQAARHAAAAQGYCQGRGREGSFGPTRTGARPRRQDAQAGDRGTEPDRQRGGLIPPSPRGSSMARKPNYDFERRERERLTALKVAEKAQAKKEARERARLEKAGTADEADAAGEAEKT